MHARGEDFLRSTREAAGQPAKRFKIEEDSLLKIRAAMPTASDDWKVESVAQYRIQYGVEQWLVKWRGYGEDRSTWEPWDNLLTEAVQAEAHQVKDSALPSVAKKLTVPLLKAALEARGKPSDGLKATLVERLLEALK